MMALPAECWGFCKPCRIPTSRIFRGAAFQQRGRAPKLCSLQHPTTGLLQDSGSQDLVEWSRAAGIQFPLVAPASFGDGLRGLMALRDIRYGDVLCSVPSKQALLATDAEACPFSDFVNPDFWSASPINVRLALKLLYEKQQGDKSKFAAWVRNLPPQIDLLVEWEPEALEALQYPYLVQKAQAVRQEWNDLHAKVQAALVGSNSITRKEWFWALACVRTRTFYGPWFATSTLDKVGAAVAALAAAGAVATQSVEAGIGAFTVGAAAVTGLVFWELDQAKKVKRLAFLPFLDLLNHSYLANKSVCYYDYSGSQHVVKSLRDYEQGEQVFMSYGRMSNDEALLYYGFMEQDNDADEYVMLRLLQWLQQYRPLEASRLKALEAAKMMGALQQAKVSTRGVFAAAVVDAVRYLLADEGSAAAGPKALKEASNPELEAQVQEALALAVRLELEACPTSVKSDFESLQGEYIPQYKQISGVGEGTEKIATLFRIEKKKILFRCLEKLSDSFNPPSASPQLVTSA